VSKSTKIFNGKTNKKKYTNSNDFDDPTKIADIFAKQMFKEGYAFDYSLESLEIEIDKFLLKYSFRKGKNGIYDKIFKTRYWKRHQVETYLTAYIGVTLIKLYGGKWIGGFYGPENPFGSNFHTSIILIKNYQFNPNHFISYYLSNGKKEEGTFYEYLYSRSQHYGILKDFLGGGLLNKIENS